jgi:cell division protein FtsB
MLSGEQLVAYRTEQMSEEAKLEQQLVAAEKNLKALKATRAANKAQIERLHLQAHYSEAFKEEAHKAASDGIGLVKACQGAEKIFESHP